jgi:hypothetical protein
MNLQIQAAQGLHLEFTHLIRSNDLSEFYHYGDEISLFLTRELDQLDAREHFSIFLSF